MRLLFIEDEPDNIRPLVNRLQRGISPCSYEITSFTDAKTAIDRFLPDIVILDLFAGLPAEMQTPGREIYDWIWRMRFCPIVIYSANPDALTTERAPHPFVKAVQKGSDSVPKVEAAIDEFRPHVDALRDTETHFRREFAYALRDASVYAFSSFSVPTERVDAFIRAGRRRLAAIMDDLSRYEQKMASWEQYVCPPVSANLKLGDVLHKVGDPNNVAASFRVVLTPSCDLVVNGGREAKVSNVLVARCCSIKSAVEQLGCAKAEKLKKVLTQGYSDNMLLLPALPKRIPHMAVNLRNLELLPLGQVSGDSKKFETVASIDSPFREHVAWAYMQIACRPGLPDRDLDVWCSEIIAATKSTAQGKENEGV